MRNFKNLSKNKQMLLNDAYPEILELYSCEETETYSQVSISVFDHWLSQEEATNELNNVSYQKQKEHNNKLHNFCVALAKSTECYLVKLLGKKKERVTFREFTSEEGLFKVLTPEPYNCGDIYRFVLVLPKLEAVYFESSDFTHHLYCKNLEKTNAVTDLATRNGLYTLNGL